MRVEGSLELATEKSKQWAKKNKRRQRKPGAMPTAVQRLFETCKEVFSNVEAGSVPSPEDVNRLRAVLDNMNAADVGLTQNLPYFRNIELGGAPPVRYLHIYECDKFSICIFCLPPSGVIPLHNHPGMTVFSKLLFGNMHIKSYDWAEAPQNSQEPITPSHFQALGLRLAEVKTDTIFAAPCETSILYPAAGGNMHCFTAMTSCAVLDVLGPPYSDPEGRHCTYYNDFPYESLSGDASFVTGEGKEYAWLEESGKPDNFFVLGANYRGPRIVDH